MQQTIKYCKVGVHHYNGVTEQTIRTITTSARTMLLYAMVCWPEEVHLNLWPFAIEYVVYLWNCLPRHPSGLSPQELFYSVVSTHDDMCSAKVRGCPTYMLDLR